MVHENPRALHLLKMEDSLERCAIAFLVLTLPGFPVRKRVMQIPTTAVLQEALDIRTQIDELETKLNGIFGSVPAASGSVMRERAQNRVAQQKKSVMSAETRARLSAAAKKRWAARRRSGHSVL